MYSLEKVNIIFLKKIIDTVILNKIICLFYRNRMFTGYNIKSPNFSLLRSQFKFQVLDLLYLFNLSMLL